MWIRSTMMMLTIGVTWRIAGNGAVADDEPIRWGHARITLCDEWKEESGRGGGGVRVNQQGISIQHLIL